MAALQVNCHQPQRVARAKASHCPTVYHDQLRNLDRMRAEGTLSERAYRRAVQEKSDAALRHGSTAALAGQQRLPAGRPQQPKRKPRPIQLNLKQHRHDPAAEATAEHERIEQREGALLEWVRGLEVAVPDGADPPEALRAPRTLLAVADALEPGLVQSWPTSPVLAVDLFLICCRAVGVPKRLLCKRSDVTRQPVPWASRAALAKTLEALRKAAKAESVMMMTSSLPDKPWPKPWLARSEYCRSRGYANDLWGWTFDAMAKGDEEAFPKLYRLLAHTGFDGATETARGGVTLLHQGVMFGCERCVDALLDMGAELDAQDSQGNTPLHWASAAGPRGKLTTKKLLYLPDNGRDVRNKAGQTPFDLALVRTNAVIAKCFDPADMKPSEVTEKDFDEFDPMDVMVQRGEMVWTRSEAAAE